MKKVYLATMDMVNSIITNGGADDGTPVGRVVFDYVLRDGYVKANGATVVEASVNYPRLVAFIREHSELLATDTEAQMTNPELYFYSWADDTLTLPNLVDRVLQGGDSVISVNAGLPNITSTLDNIVSIGGIPDSKINADSALTWRTKHTTTISTFTSYSAADIVFDASKSNSIYGASTTVQPPAVKLIPQIKYRSGADGQQVVVGDSTPLGTIIMFMGTVAPANYLFCDGTVYNITNYQKLASFIAEQFGSVNHFGGDGETTFAVPDLRGEFLRCTGTNSHTDQGNGEAVGVHQDATRHKWIAADSSAIGATTQDGLSNQDWRNYNQGPWIYAKSGTIARNDWMSHYTSRPTNTSVMYCIKAKTGDEQ